MSKNRYVVDTKTDRPNYLQQLVQEYTVSTDLEAKQQVLANLANFAYDPSNYAFLWDVYAIDLFLEAIQGEDQLLKEFGLGGVANICTDSQHRDYVLSKPSSLRAITACVSSNHTECSINAMTTLLLLLISATDLSTRKHLLTIDLERRLRQVLANPTLDIRVRTMAQLFITDHYSHPQDAS
ncbi:hypothetical protein BCR43DRAFT_521649 [Syncephalastrum racemosum]|uniref:Armadillo-type protein n=1 Tax=Syncephalastrum racemosum TaxID=13706 RepID=A0A1X2HMT2_SYNRA|nr:hypothetical protein BCR43DRAFT_521649 [Syncephalastrum racemosum]